MILDAETIIGGYLRADADVVALDARVLGQTPKTLTDPWVRITQLDADAVPSSRADYLISYLIQLDCYAGKEGLDGSQKKQASLLARTVRAALHILPEQELHDAVVSSVRFAGMARIPDTDFEPARERVALTAIVHMHVGS